MAARSNGLGLGAAITDTHVHVFDPARFVYDPLRLYTPSAATEGELRVRDTAHGIARCILVQPSVYGADNRCLLDAIASGGQARYRGVAVINMDNTSQAEIDELHQGGVRGIRLNLAVTGETNATRIEALLTQAAGLIRRTDWSVQIHCDESSLPTITRTLDRFAVPLVLDHFGGLHADDAAIGTTHAALWSLLSLLDSGRVYVKLSALYRASRAPEPHDDLLPLMTHLIWHRADRLLWGSDWPHTGGGASRARNTPQIEPFRQVNLESALALLRRCCPDLATEQRILIDNPTTLYGFAA